MKVSPKRVLRLIVATSFLLLLLLLGSTVGSAQTGTTGPPVSIDDNAVVQTRPTAPQTGTTLTAAVTTVPPLGPIAPAPTLTPAGGTASSTFYVILLVTIPLLTVATIVWLQSQPKRRPLRTE